MDGMAKRERTAAGDELSEEFGGVGSARLNRVAAGKEAVYVPASETARRRNHRLVVNNSRFLIVPSVKVKCLASWVLARVEKRLAQDWEQVYGYRPVLMETYVERGRFAGTCYRAANWMWVGVSTG